MREEILGQETVHEKGRLRRVRRWWRGVHPERGVIVRGLTGWETVEETDRLVPQRTFTVGNRRSR